jgi:putative two-component system response regulator
MVDRHPALPSRPSNPGFRQEGADVTGPGRTPSLPTGRAGGEDLLAIPDAGRWRAGVAEGAPELRQARILIVDDEPTNLRLLARALNRAGFSEVQGISNPFETLPLFRSFRPDLVLLDLHMPGLDGISLLEQLRANIPSETYLPILMITGDGRSEPRRAALAQGASDFLVKPFDPPEVVLRIQNMLETRALHLILQQQNERLEVKVQARTRDLEESQLEVLERLAVAAEFRDDDTGRHTQRVAAVAEVLAQALGLGGERVALLRRTAPLHDVGKIGIPDQILLKPGRLSPEEFDVMKTHTTIGSRILGGGRSALMRMAELIARSHHERWDGAGYPDQLSGEAIPIEARVLAVADFFDALTHARPYRPAWPLDRVRAEILELRDRHFDPRVVDVFFGLECSERICE